MANRSRTGVPLPSNTEGKGDGQLEELLVFGYSCKLFRDDEKASLIDRGGHLIPWMADPSLLIDRYDGRGHLYDLKPYDADLLPKQGWSHLSDDQQRFEAILDEERYLELHTDITEQNMYEEEEIKRLNEALQDNPYGAVGFNYSAPPPEQEEAEAVAAESPSEEDNEEEQESFVIPQGLQVPDGMHMPPNRKMNAIIEKTAKFVALQGQQMEIVIKTKQQHNAQFDFLNYAHYLNPYYKHVVKMIKSGKYRPQVQQPPPKPVHDYLHPSLAAQPMDGVIKEISSKKFLESVKSKLPAGQLENSSYAALVKNLARHTAGRNSPDPSITVQQQAEKKAVLYGPAGPTVPPAPHEAPKEPLPGPPGYQSDSGQPMYGPSLPPPPGMEPVTLPGHPQPPPPGTVPPEPPPDMETQPEDDSDMPLGPHIISPTPEFQPIVDKMAAYVAKNGPDFETVVKSKNDPRFQFLQSWHEHYAYYSYKRQMFEEEFAAKAATEEEKKASSKDDSEGSEYADTSPSAKMIGVPKAVSFSIKPKETEAPQKLGGRRKALLGGDSSDEEGGNLRQEEAEAVAMATEDLLREADAIDAKEAKSEKSSQSCEETEKRERREGGKWAEDRLKDRLAVAAKDKLVQVAKENQLKAERKKKAAKFLMMLKSNGPKVEDETSNQTLSATSAAASPLVSPMTSAANSPRRANTPTPAKAPSSKAQSPASSPPPPSHRTKSSRRSRTRSRSRSRLRSRSRSRSRSRRRSRSRTPSYSRMRYRARTPPTAYSVMRRSKSRSPMRRISPKLPLAFRSSKRSGSPSNRSPPPPKYRNRGRSRSRSPNRSIKPSKRDNGKASHRSHKTKKDDRKDKERSTDKKDRDKKDNKSSRRSRSRSKDRSRKSSKSPKKKSKKKEKERERSRSKSPPPKKVEVVKMSESKNGNSFSPDVPPPPPEPMEAKELESGNPAPQPELHPSLPQYESEDDDVIIVEKKAVDKNILNKVRAMIQASKEQVHEEIL